MGEIRIVGPGKTRGYPYPVCKKRCCRMLYTVKAVVGAYRIGRLSHHHPLSLVHPSTSSNKLSIETTGLILTKFYIPVQSPGPVGIKYGSNV